MNSIKTSHELLEQLEILSGEKNKQEESKNLIQLLKLALIKDKAEVDALSQNMDEGLAHCQIICDQDGVPYDYKFLSVNKALEKQTGLKASEVVGKTFLQIFPKSDTFWIDFYGKVALTQRPNSVSGFGHNTQRHYVSSAYSTVPGEFTMLFKDVSESVALSSANLEIAKYQKSSSAVLANMQEAFSHCEIICDEINQPIDFRFLYVNSSFESQTGVKADDALGKKILELFPDIEKSWIRILGKVALTGKSNSFVNYNHNTGRYYQVSAFSPDKGEFAAFIRDISEQEHKRIELEKAHSKAEENERLKSAFLANLSHEIRTPMNAILGFSSHLESAYLSNEERKTCLENIKSSSNRLLTLISDILDISKIDAQQQKLVFSECNLNQLLDGLFEQHSILNINSKIELTLEKGLKNHDANISTDEIRLSQILSNLIENGIKFTPEGKVIFGYTLEQKKLKFYVKDTGVGLQKKDQLIIFDRFAQVKNEAQPIASGSGLGISIANGLVSLFKGEMWVDSEIGEGTCFYFTIPFIPPKKKMVPKTYKNTILIAEDDDVNFLLLNLWLNSHFNIVHASNGFEAVQLFQQHQTIDIIIMDIRMPYMNGIQATEEIRKLDANIPIIAHTAFAMGEESVLIKNAGCNIVLVKPITRDELLSVLAKFKITT